ncbi:MAG: hypothetical protein IKJ89_00690 [Kiritimatiellae bacterium]|nr:hypothetical protein [Kiritimatiellia bacterium]
MKKKVNIQIESEAKEKRTTPSIQYRIPRRDAWYASLSEEERSEVLTLPEKMNADKAVKYIEKKFGKKISRASYYRGIDGLNHNRLASAHLKAVSKPPALDVLNDLAKTVKSIDKTLKTIMQKSK